MVGQLLSDRLHDTRNGPEQAFRPGHRVRHLQPRQLRPRVRIGQGTVSRQAVVISAGPGPDAHRAHHVPAAVRRAAAATAVPAGLRSKVRPAGVAAAAVLPGHAVRTAAVFVTVTVTAAPVAAVLSGQAHVGDAVAPVPVLPRHADHVRYVYQTYGYLRAIFAAHHVLPNAG